MLIVKNMGRRLIICLQKNKRINFEKKKYLQKPSLQLIKSTCQKDKIQKNSQQAIRLKMDYLLEFLKHRNNIDVSSVYKLKKKCPKKAKSQIESFYKKIALNHKSWSERYFFERMSSQLSLFLKYCEAWEIEQLYVRLQDPIPKFLNNLTQIRFNNLYQLSIKDQKIYNIEAFGLFDMPKLFMIQLDTNPRMCLKPLAKGYFPQLGKIKIMNCNFQLKDFEDLYRINLSKKNSSSILLSIECTLKIDHALAKLPNYKKVLQLESQNESEDQDSD